LCYVIDSGLSTSLLLLATLIIMFYITLHYSHVCNWLLALSMMLRGIRSQVSMFQLVNVAYQFLCNVR